MPSLTSRSSRGLLTFASCGFTSAVVLSALWLDPERSLLLFLGTCGIFALAFLLILPVQFLPLTALLLIFTVPDRIADFTLFPLVTPAVVVLLVWLVRKSLSHPDRSKDPKAGEARKLRRAVLVVNLSLAAWLGVQLVLSPSLLGLSWALTYVVAVVAPHFVSDTERETQLLRSAFPWVGAATALYAVAQAASQSNVIYAALLKSLGRETVAQHWAVYRSDGSFGHPLIAGLFFAVVLAHCVGRWLETGRVVFVWLAVANGAGIISTVSRGSYIAAGLAVAGVIVLSLFDRRRSGGFRHFVMLAGCSAFAYVALHTTSFLDRAASQEASDSSLVRANLPYITYETARRYHWLGSGPATSLMAAAPFNVQGLRIENSYFQGLISLGVPGLILFVANLALAILLALRLRNFGAAAALMALAVGLSGFAALDGLRNVLVLLGLLGLMALHRDSAGEPQDAPRAQVRTSAGTAGVV